MLRNVLTKPLFEDDGQRPQCIQEGCTHLALFFCVYGCLCPGEHTYEGYFCQPCWLSKRDRIRFNVQNTTNGSVQCSTTDVVWACEKTWPLVDFVWVKLTDSFRRVYDLNGERIWQ